MEQSSKYITTDSTRRLDKREEMEQKKGFRKLNDIAKSIQKREAFKRLYLHNTRGNRTQKEKSYKEGK
jgi:hypothetical protein